MNARTQFVLTEIRRTGAIAVDDLAARTGASNVTIRRVLSTLESQGLVVRRRGRAETPAPLLNYAIRDSGMVEEKRRIGLAAAALIAPGDVVGFGPGTSTTAAACAIPPELAVDVVTNAVNIAIELFARPHTNVYLTGGNLRQGWFSLSGQTAVDAMRQVVVDQAIVGITGIHPEHGLTDDHREEAAVTRALLAQAKRRIVVADHTKFGRFGHALVWPLDKLDIIITDTGATEETLAPYTAKGVQIIRA